MKKSKIKNSVILVTGGAGFIGSHLIDQLLIYKPKKIYLLDSLYRGKLKNIAHLMNHPTVEFVKGDIRNNSLVNRLMSRSDYCFHLASISINACASYPQKAFDVMLSGTFNIARSAVKYKVKKLIFSSSASIYGLAQHFPTPETDNPYNNQTFYGAAKLFSEQLLRSYHYMYGLPYVALRYFNVYGVRMDVKGRYTAVFIKWLDSIRNSNQPIVHGDGSTTMDFVYVTDVARANILALESDVTDEVFNIGTSQETSLKQLLELLLKINHANIKPKYIESKMVNPVQRRRAAIKKAEALIGFKPKIYLEEGLKLLCEWYSSKKK